MCVHNVWDNQITIESSGIRSEIAEQRVSEDQ